MPPVETLAAYAKLTRALRVVGIREDGYHLLEAEMTTVDLADELEIEQGGDGLEVLDEVAFLGESDAAGRQAAPTAFGADNLVTRALQAVGRRARVRLTKRIPAGAGLGGGSSDAAAVLRWAGSEDATLAAFLGADVPFCLVGGRARVSGIGEQVEPLEFEDFTAVLVTPAISVSTPEVYRAWDVLGGPSGEQGNDLEPAAVFLQPRLLWWRDLVSSVAGERPRLAGSGGTWYLERSREAAGPLAAELSAAVRAEGARALVVAVSSVPAARDLRARRSSGLATKRD
jgi:4-diphosphocytidyl-2-C-methyl-D-erythritol kinase